MSLEPVDTENWSLSATDPGAIVKDDRDINQSLSIILSTEPGTDPTRPTFGADIYRYLDRPVNDAIPGIKQGIIEAVRRWEPRVVVERVLHEISGAELTFTVFWRSTASTGKTEMSYAIR